MTKKTQSRPHDIVCDDKHLTKQDHGGMADINTIAQRYMTGRLEYPTELSPVYADLSQVDVARSRNLLASLESDFAELPSEVRANFDNDYGQYVNWIDENQTEIEKVGIREALWTEVNEPDPAPDPDFAQKPEIEAPDAPEGGKEQHS